MHDEQAEDWEAHEASENSACLKLAPKTIGTHRVILLERMRDPRKIFKIFKIFVYARAHLTRQVHPRWPSLARPRSRAPRELEATQHLSGTLLSRTEIRARDHAEVHLRMQTRCGFWRTTTVECGGSAEGAVEGRNDVHACNSLESSCRF